MRDDCLYIFGHNFLNIFLNICPIFKLFFFKFSERLAPSVGVHKGTASYPISRDKRPRDNRVSLYVLMAGTPSVLWRILTELADIYNAIHGRKTRATSAKYFRSLYHVTSGPRVTSFCTTWPGSANHASATTVSSKMADLCQQNSMELVFSLYFKVKWQINEIWGMSAKSSSWNTKDI